ncbi:MAG: hypothetical protein CR968_01985 [Flavobacteriia bacterium]|nr:MAG: hypothetical protein CR968_01985 [Flavobacteriia bacterium]
MRTFLQVTLLTLSVFIVSCKPNAADKISDEAAAMAKEKIEKSKSGFPELVFESEVYEFGTVNEGDIVNATYKLTNTGETDLVILSATASCGCTVPDYPKNKPIKPGESEIIKARFDTKRKPNKQNKSVTLIANTKEQRHKVYIKGFVTPKKK